MYAIPGINSPSPQTLKAVIYADSGGSPGALVATGTEVTYQGSSNGSGWFELPFGSPVALSPGTYWLGFITGTTTEGMGYVYESVANSRAYNANTYTSGPSNPFGSATKDSEQASIYATYTPTAPSRLSTAACRRSAEAAARPDADRQPRQLVGLPHELHLQWLRCSTTGTRLRLHLRCKRARPTRSARPT